jgi:hypothetical protein
MRHVLLALTVGALTSAGSCGRSAEEETVRREEEFARAMSGATLAGKFSSGRSDKLAEDRYTIGKVTKLAGDLWTIESRIQYGGRDVTVPVPIRVNWAGDTAVMSMTDEGVPGLGTFTVRILVYRGQYAGTWSNSKGHGGQMWGRIERPAGK